MFSLDDRKDEGLRFPPAAQKLELLLLHELGRLKCSRGPADEKLAAMVSEASMVTERLRDIFVEPFKRVSQRRHIQFMALDSSFSYTRTYFWSQSRTRRTMSTATRALIQDQSFQPWIIQTCPQKTTATHTCSRSNRPHRQSVAGRMKWRRRCHPRNLPKIRAIAESFWHARLNCHRS